MSFKIHRKNQKVAAGTSHPRRVLAELLGIDEERIKLGRDRVFSRRYEDGRVLPTAYVLVEDDDPAMEPVTDEQSRAMFQGILREHVGVLA